MKNAGARSLLALGLLGLAACGRDPVHRQVGLDPDPLLRDVSYLAGDELAGRLAGSAGAGMARAFVLERFRQLGLAPAYDGFASPFRFDRSGQPVEGVNVVAKLDGTDPALAERWLVLSAHYDHLGVRGGQVFNGADDNASGVAALLAIAAALAERPLGRPVLFAAFDAEEPGQWGARSFVGAPPVPLEQVAIAINLDMLGRGDGGALWAAGTHYRPWLRAPLARAAERATVPLRFGHDVPGTAHDWTTDSDHAAFHAAGIPWVYFGVEDHADYHRPTDDAERIDAEFLAAATALVLEALRELDAALATDHEGAS
jgi:Zn-dependent M28 family amino/carboxypeptidase